MSHTDLSNPTRRFDFPVWVLAGWVAVMGTLYVRAMAAERGQAMLAPIAAVAEKVGLSRQ